MLQCQLQLAVERPGVRRGRIPEEAVVNDEKIDSPLHGHLEWHQSGIHGGPDAVDAAAVFQLQSIVGARKIRVCGTLGQAIAKFPDIVQVAHDRKGASGWGLVQAAFLILEGVEPGQAQDAG
jgi:hypothetical protein